MTLLKTIVYAYLIMYLAMYASGILIYLEKKHRVLRWLYNSLNYPLRKRRIDKLFKSLTENNKLVVWQKSVDIEDESKWDFRKLELFIRKKYIEPILKQHGEI